MTGVLDWDLASAFDPALDAACLAWHGWDKVRAAVDAETVHRAGTWALTFGLEQIAFAVLNNEPAPVVSQTVERMTTWLEHTNGWDPFHA